MAYTANDPCPTQSFLYLREEEKVGGGKKEKKKKEGEGGGEKVSLKTHATARGMGKNWFKKEDPFNLKWVG